MQQRVYRADLIGSIRGALAGLQGFDAMAFELIQNADDAGASWIRFDVLDDRLVVENDSVFSSCGRVAEDADCQWKDGGNPRGGNRACDFHALSTVSSANKSGEGSLIGRFGVGFVSVYQITDRPIICSGKTELALDPAAEGATIRLVPIVPGTRIELPWAIDPKTPLRQRLADFRLPTDAADQMLQALVGAVGRTLFFLRNVKMASVSHRGQLRERVSIKRANGRLTIQRGSEKQPEEWLLLSGDASASATQLVAKFDGGGLERRQTTVQIAFRCDQARSQEELGQLYAYLPTDDPSGLPCHINGDFFPKQDRKTIVLAGHGSQQAWNEMLLHVAAQAIAGNLLLLRDALGAGAFWRLLVAASRLTTANDGPQRDVFHCFWKEISTHARGLAIVPTSAQGDWSIPQRSRLVRIGLASNTESVLRRLGIELPHSTVTRVTGAREAIQALGGKPLSLADISASLQSLPPDGLAPDEARALWPLVNTLLGTTPAPAAASIDLLKKASFLLNQDGDLSSINDLYRVPPGVTNAKIHAVLSDVPLADEVIREHGRLWQLIDLLGPSQIAAELADRVTDPSIAQQVLGPDLTRPRRLYALLSDYPGMSHPDLRDAVRKRLSACPILKTAKGFSAPSDAVVSSDFADPTGSIALVDPAVLNAETAVFLRTVLGVDTLSFRDYVIRRLPGILKKGIDKQRFPSLLLEFVRHDAILHEQDVFNVAQKLSLCWRSDGRSVSPNQALLKTEELESLLGGKFDGWLDETTLPADYKDLARSILRRLGLRSFPSAADMVARISETVAAGPPTVDRRRAIAAVAVAVARHLPDYKQPADLVPLNQLKLMSWIPCKGTAEQEGAWKRPREVFQPYRAEAFRSQVAVADLPANQVGMSEFLNRIDMPSAPPADVLAAHLLWCLERGEKPPEASYAMLSEALERNETGFVAMLTDRPILWNSNQKLPLRARQVFWSLPRPRLRGFFLASEEHRRYKKLFDELGVSEEPTALHFGRWLLDFSERLGRMPLPGDDGLAHAQCVGLLADALDAEPDAKADIRAMLEDAPVVQSRAALLAAPRELAAVDAEWLAERLGDGFAGQLASGGVGDKSARVYAVLGVPLLSTLARGMLVEVSGPQRRTDLEARLRQREPLLQCILRFHQPPVEPRIGAVLRSLIIEEARSIGVRYEFRLSDPPSVTRPVAADAYADLHGDRARVLIRSGATRQVFQILRSLFLDILTGLPATEVGQAANSAKDVVEAESEEQAWAILRDIGYVDTPQGEATDAPSDDADLDGFDQTVEAQEGCEAPLEGQEETGQTEASESGDSDSAEPSATDDTSHDRGRRGADGTHGGSDPERPSTPPNPGRHVDAPSSVNGANAQPAGRHADTTGSGNGTDTEPDRSRGTAGSSASSGSQSARSPASGLITSTIVVAREALRMIKDRYGKPFSASEKSDEGAMLAAVRYELAAGRVPDLMPHNHPGFDIKSRNGAGDLERLIEVKGIAGSWDGSAVRLSGTQFDHAAEHADTYWVYVVEFAQDPGKQRLYAIRDPFAHTDHFCLDEGWRYAAEDQAQGTSVRFVAGAAVRHKAFGRGTILEIRERGRLRSMQVKFHEGGIKNLLASDPQLEPLDT
jgi:hypothetical protein